MRIISFLFLIIIVFFGISFATLNSEYVSVNYYLGQASIPLSLLLVLVFVLGALTTMLISFWLLLKAKVKNYRLRQRLHVAEKEIENLRAIPLKDKV